MSSLAEKELREKDERLRLALVATGLGTWEMDLVHNRRHWSDETFALHGLTRTHETDDHIELNDKVMHPDDRKRLAELHDELRRGRDDYLFEYRTTLPNGSERWISARGKVLERLSVGPTRIVGVTADITEQKWLRQVQDRQNAQFRLLADALPQLVWVADSRGRVTYYNRRRQLYYQEPQVAPSDPQRQPLIHPDDHQSTAAAWARALQIGQEYEMEHRLRMADGHYRWHLTRATPSLDVYGKVTSWFGTATDIARLKDAEVRIAAGEDRLQLATEAAGMFAWEVDLSTGKIEWADNAATVIGCSSPGRILSLSRTRSWGAFKARLCSETVKRCCISVAKARSAPNVVTTSSTERPCSKSKNAKTSCSSRLAPSSPSCVWPGKYPVDGGAVRMTSGTPSTSASA